MFQLWIVNKTLPDHVMYLTYEEYKNGMWAAREWEDEDTQTRFRNYNGYDINGVYKKEQL
jgi:hypothetical protein